MVDSRVNEFYETSASNLDKAREELSRPAEDVVTFAVCAPTREAIYGFLKSLYMHYKQEDPEIGQQAHTVDDLISYCREFDSEINSMDFSPLYCKKKDIYDENEILFCNDIESVTACTKLGEQLQKVVKNRISVG